MNEEQIEILLQRGTVLKAPAGLLENLIAGIHLPQPARDVWATPRSPWYRRWMPALSFAAIFLGCLVAIAMQTNLMSELTKQNESLRAAAQPLETLRQENVEYQRLANENRELDRLRKDNAELEQLRAEVAQRNAQLQSLASLRAENQRLRGEAAALSAAPAAGNDFFADAKGRAERIACCNNLKQVGLAVRIWAGDNNELTPPDIISMTNELATWKILQCPSDTSHTVTSWEDVKAGNVSYQFLVPNIKQTDAPNTVMFICPIHHNIGLLDGSVQQLSPEAFQTKLKMVNGREVYEP